MDGRKSTPGKAKGVFKSRATKRLKREKGTNRNSRKSQRGQIGKPSVSTLNGLKETRYSIAEPDISFSRSPFVDCASTVPWARSKHASFPLVSI